MGTRRDALRMLYGVVGTNVATGNDDPVAKARTLENKALEAKRQAFDKLKADDPMCADFVSGAAMTFGKPRAIAIRFSDGSRYDGGQFVPAQSFPDFNARCLAPLYQCKRTSRNGK